jgi:hypothetical protein
MPVPPLTTDWEGCRKNGQFLPGRRSSEQNLTVSFYSAIVHERRAEVAKRASVRAWTPEIAFTDQSSPALRRAFRAWRLRHVLSR